MAGLTIKEVQQRMLLKAEGSGLDASDVKKLGFKAITAEDSRKTLKVAKHGAGFIIPYFSLHGKPDPSFYRVRYMEDMRKGFERVTQTKSQRYTQPLKSPPRVYFPPLLPPGRTWADYLSNAEAPVIITEGELKAAAATKAGLPTIGLGGVWMFRSTKQGEPFIEELDSIEWEGRPVTICYDSDAGTNPDIVAAEGALAKELNRRGALVSIARIPTNGDVAVKVGLDDWLVSHGMDAKRLLEEVIEPAPLFSECEVLHGLNKEVLFVKNPGFIYCHEDGQRLTPDQFKNSVYANRFYHEKKMIGKNEVLVEVPAAPKWIQWPYRAEVKGVTYAPGEPSITEDNKLNTWTGWGVHEPREGSIEPWHHLLDHLFGGNDEMRVWFERWCAYPIQHPGTKLHTAVLMWGVVHGSGKTLVGHTLMRLYGKHSAELKDTDLDDTSNTWAADMSFVLGDDISSKLDRKTVRRFMTMTTQKYVRLNPKYVPQYSLPDLINYFLTSNEPDALYLDEGDRRFFVWEVLAQKYAAYREYVAWRDDDDAGIMALWHYLLHYDLGDFDPHAPAPETQGKAEMMTLGKSDLGSFVKELKENGHVLLRKKQMKGDLFTAKELMMLYDPDGSKKVTLNALARELKKQGFRHPATGTSLDCPDGSQVMVYAILNGDKWVEAKRAEARAHYVESKPKGYWEVQRSKM